MNSPTLSLFRFQNEPNIPFVESDEADTGVRGLVVEGIWIDCGRDDSTDRRGVAGSVLASRPSPAPGPVVLVRVGTGLGCGGGAIAAEDWGLDGAVDVGGCGACEVCRFNCSSSISALASAIARFDRAILSVVRSVLCECKTEACDLD